jgi:hypothetical protein
MKRLHKAEDIIFLTIGNPQGRSKDDTRAKLIDPILRARGWSGEASLKVKYAPI